MSCSSDNSSSEVMDDNSFGEETDDNSSSEETDDNSPDDDMERAEYIPMTIYSENIYSEYSQVTISEDGTVTTTNLNDELQLNSASNYYEVLSKELLTFYSLMEDNLGIK
ncbi:hypothetical protein [Allomuricauda sp. SCSIO 65647]|uniref:hypothetical protein n=1 Tax=Allomuricauda sp. SCSIO 65647 TaxID=2908843 RepID=UPI001F1B5AFF|nr:hypothetical protein [Muricauda sp. SCSIO 65647]UJH66491.1 hypothetical protein L0P89_11005 [Muricauda sp. SCSIO 65647]